MPKDTYISTTRSIKVIVETQYQPAYSNVQARSFVFAYRITIENHGTENVQLLRRHWHIWDCENVTRQVEGEGVVGKQPVLGPSQIHQYVSSCNIPSEMGAMWGNYTFLNLETDELFEVEIPRFNMLAPWKSN